MGEGGFRGVSVKPLNFFLYLGMHGWIRIELCDYKVVEGRGRMKFEDTLEDTVSVDDL